MSASSRALAAVAVEGAFVAAAYALGVGLGGYLLLRGLASGALALLLHSLVPGALLFSVSFAVPLVGVVGILAAARMMRAGAARRPRHDFEMHALPLYEGTGETPGARSRAGIRVRLSNPAAPTEARLRALLAMQAMPARMANPVIREMLADASDDLRLIAYGILDTREKTINARIHEAVGQLAQADRAGQAALHKQLAELYGELVYQGLVQGDLRLHATAQARAHVERALDIDAGDAALHALAGQIALSSGDHQAAQVALEQARLLGLPQSRVLPYLAEVAFAARRFGEVRACAALLAGRPNLHSVEQVVDYWGKPCTPISA